MIPVIASVMESVIEVAYKCHISWHVIKTVASTARKVVGTLRTNPQEVSYLGHIHKKNGLFGGISFPQSQQGRIARSTQEFSRFKTITGGMRYYPFLSTCQKRNSNRLAEDKRLIQDVHRLYRHYPKPALNGTQLALAKMQTPYETLLSPEEMGNTYLHLRDQKFLLSPDLDELSRTLDYDFRAYCSANHIENANSDLVRITSDIVPGGELTAAKVDYQLTTVTNLVMDLPVSPAFRHMGRTVREYDSRKTHGSYPSIKDSSLASPLGVALIVITRDDYVILTHRSRYVSCYSDVCGPSASGYADYVDGDGVGTRHTVLHLCAQTARKEAHEELSISIELMDITPLGLYREYLRTMPQAFLAVSVDKNLDEVIGNARCRGGRALCSETQGLLGIKKSEFRGLLPGLLANTVPGSPRIGLEACGLLVALAKHAPSLVGMD